MLNALREAAMTIRCHTQRTIKPQTVAEHSYHVAMLVWKLCDREPSAELIKAALFHDLAEAVTGDIPATLKWKSPTIKAELQRFEELFDAENHLYVSLTPKEEAILKWADGLELMWHCIDEINMGNRFVLEMYNQISEHLKAALSCENQNVPKNVISEFNNARSAYAIAITR